LPTNTLKLQSWKLFTQLGITLCITPRVVS